MLFFKKCDNTTLNNLKFYNNTSVEDGGGMVISQTTNITLADFNFDNNTAEKNG